LWGAPGLDPLAGYSVAAVGGGVSADDVVVSTDQRVETGVTQLDRRPARRLGSLLIGIVLLALKADAYAHLLSDSRVLVLVLLGIAAVIALLHGRPLRMAIASGSIVGVAVDLPSVWLRIGVGASAVVALVGVSVAVGTLLQWHDQRAVS
jgi:hypothetical protein